GRVTELGTGNGAHIRHDVLREIVDGAGGAPDRSGSEVFTKDEQFVDAPQVQVRLLCQGQVVVGVWASEACLDGDGEGPAAVGHGYLEERVVADDDEAGGGNAEPGGGG